MSAFRAGDVDVLVCTTVIEVGVDVANATVMVVMDADRFGISQLHQLRGRIGRGQHPSLCLLATNLAQASKAGERLKAVAATLDGFELADLDLQRASRGRRVGLQPVRSAHHVAAAVARRAPRDHRSGTRLRGIGVRHGPRADANPGIAVLAAPFSDTERVEYLDKA